MIRQDIRDNLIRKALADVFRRPSDAKLKMIFKHLSEDYSHDTRHYHTLDHIAEMLALAENHPLDNAQAFKAAVLYHDCVYDPRNYGAKDKTVSNEEHSAIVCTTLLDFHGVKKEVAERARELILMTKSHVAPAGDTEAALFLDLDMAILGMPANRYQFYARANAREFLSAFTPEQYIEGRRKFLNDLLSRNNIFQTFSFESMEAPARENIAWELENLESIVTRAVAKPAMPVADLVAK